MVVKKRTRERRERKTKENSNCDSFSLPLLLGHVRSEHDHGFVAVVVGLGVNGVSRKEKKGW